MSWLCLFRPSIQLIQLEKHGMDWDKIWYGRCSILRELEIYFWIYYELRQQNDG